MEAPFVQVPSSGSKSTPDMGFEFEPRPPVTSTPPVVKQGRAVVLPCERQLGDHRPVAGLRVEYLDRLCWGAPYYQPFATGNEHPPVCEHGTRMKDAGLGQAPGESSFDSGLLVLGGL